MTDEREYRGYIIKKEPRSVGFGKEFVVYRDNELICRCDREKVAEETIDWHITYR
ncbi:MAG: hypothetical protein J6S14_22935 [Clostridia bacterium]|nr:hypothetical protein [Clostridia bacterium]